MCSDIADQSVLTQVSDKLIHQGFFIKGICFDSSFLSIVIPEIPSGSSSYVLFSDYFLGISLISQWNFLNSQVWGLKSYFVIMAVSQSIVVGIQGSKVIDMIFFPSGPIS